MSGDIDTNLIISAVDDKVSVGKTAMQVAFVKCSSNGSSGADLNNQCARFNETLFNLKKQMWF